MSGLTVVEAGEIPTSVQEEGTWFDVLGVPVSILTLESAAQRIELWASDDTGRFVCIREVASLMAIRDDPEISVLHRDAAMITPDGMPLVRIGRSRGLPVERVCGPDLIELMMARSAGKGLKHYFYGGQEGVAEEMAARFRSRYPDVHIVGCECPPFRELSPEEIDDTLERIGNSGADIVWVGLSSPKQDVWMWKHHKRLPQTLIGVGAAFDFHSGKIQRAPVWMQKAGLEWLHRLASEPRRLWRRYLILAPRFLLLVLRDRSGAGGHA